MEFGVKFEFEIEVEIQINFKFEFEFKVAFKIVFSSLSKICISM